MGTLASPAIHPFPARMAPEIVSEMLDALSGEAIVLDPMMGSGSFPLAASRRGHLALGFDTDPLAILIGRTALCMWDPDGVLRAAGIAAKGALQDLVDWVHPDPESDAFIDFWFDPLAKRRLAALARQIGMVDVRVRDPLWVGFSRLIITKDSGASRARDVSHSRPHRVRSEATLDPITAFTGAVRRVVERSLAFGPPRHGGGAYFARADARLLPLADGSVHAIMTSPPYFNAIDYMRGHRMTLVWMGHTIAELRTLRAENIGSERAGVADARSGRALETVRLAQLSRRQQGMLVRYACDLARVMDEVARVLANGGVASFVVADSTMDSVRIGTGSIVGSLARSAGLELVGSAVRELPARSRYLPIPSATDGNPLGGRMRSEEILRFQKRWT